MGKLTLYIYGLAVCHLAENDKSWKVFFPKAEDHPFQIVVRKKNKVGGHSVNQLKKFFVPAGKEFEITANNSALNQKVPSGMTKLTGLIGKKDLTLNDLVADKSKFAARGTLKGFKLKTVYLKLHLPQYAPEETNKVNRYKVLEEGTPTPTKEIETKNSLRSDTINTADSDKTVLSLEGEVLETLDHSDKADYEIFLYNNCDESPGGCEPKSDFDFYYNILKSGSVKKVKLEAIEDSTMGDRVGCDGVLLP